MCEDGNALSCIICIDLLKSIKIKEHIKSQNKEEINPHDDTCSLSQLSALVVVVDMSQEVTRGSYCSAAVKVSWVSDWKVNRNLIRQTKRMPQQRVASFHARVPRALVNEIAKLLRK